MTKLILASQSPRRREILSSLGYVFDVEPSSKEEVFDLFLSLDDALMQVALAKGMDIFASHPDDVVLAADTIVCQDGRIFGKPKDEQDAFEMLKGFSGRWHQVKTAVVLLAREHRYAIVETTNVRFRELSDEEIWNYIHTGTCMDKAGSYGIQDVDFVQSLEGSYSNVVGLPITRTDALLKAVQCDPDIQI